MKAIFFNKTVNTIVLVALLPYFIAGVSTAAHADSKSAVKEVIRNEGKIKISDVKATDNNALDTKVVDAKPMDSAGKTPADPDFKKLDANNDGKLSLKEAVKDKALAASFDATDANHDGMLAADEYTNYKTGLAIKAAEPVPAASGSVSPPAGY